MEQNEINDSVLGTPNANNFLTSNKVMQEGFSDILMYLSHCVYIDIVDQLLEIFERHSNKVRQEILLLM